MVGKKSNNRENYCSSQVVAEQNHGFPILKEFWSLETQFYSRVAGFLLDRHHLLTVRAH